jgi:hypothetical protein
MPVPSVDEIEALALEDSSARKRRWEDETDG